MGLGMALALITGGAATSIPELIILGSMFEKKLILAFAFNAFLVTIAGKFMVEWLVYCAMSPSGAIGFPTGPGQEGTVEGVEHVTE
jgi:hypothetical protein